MVKHRLRGVRRYSGLIAGAGITLLVMTVAAALAMPANTAEARSHQPEQAPLPQTQQVTPSLSVAAVSDSIVEGGRAQFTISADPAPSGSLTVNYTVSQQGDFVYTERYGNNVYDMTIHWKDRHLGSKTATINGSSVTITVPTVDDNHYAPGGSTTLTLNTGSGYTLSASSSATVTRVENEPDPTVTIAALDSKIAEGSNARFKITRQPGSGSTIQVKYRVTQVGEYVANANVGDQEIAVSGSQQILSVPTSRDYQVNPHGLVSVELLPGDGYLVGQANTAAITVENRDATPVLTVTANAASFTEGSPAEFTIHANPVPSGSITVNYEVAQVGAYVESWNVGDKTRTVSGASAPVAVVTSGNSEHGPNGLAMVFLRPGNGYVLGQAHSARAVIKNDDPYLPEVSVTANAGVTEGQDASYVFSVNPAPTGSVTVHYTVAQNGNMVSAANAGDQTATLSATSNTVRVPTVNDDTGEPDDTVTVTINDGAGYRAGSPASASVPVDDNDGYPTITITDAPQSILEDEVAKVTIRASEPKLSTVEGLYVKYRVEHRGKTIERHALFPFGGTTTTFNIWADADGIIGPDDVMTVTIVDAAGYQVGSPGSASVTVKNVDKDPHTITMSVPATVSEGDSFDITFTISEALNGSLKVRYRIGGLYDDIQYLTIPAGAVKGTATITTAENEYGDGDLTYAIYIIDAGAHKKLNWQASITVVEDDPNPVLSVVTVPDVQAPEATEGSPVKFVIKASEAPTGNLPVKYRVRQTYGDFVANAQLGTKTATLSGTELAINIPTIDDTVKESRGTIVLEILNGRGYRYDRQKHDGTYYVADNDGPPAEKPVLDITSPAEVTEGEDITYTIRANPAPEGDLTVYYFAYQAKRKDAVKEGRFVDRSYLGYKKLTMNGATATITIPTIDDQEYEPDGSVTIVLPNSSPDKYTLKRTPDVRTTTTVLDNDVPEVLISPSQSTVVEGESAEFLFFASPHPISNLDVSVTITQTGDYGVSVGTQTVTIPDHGRVYLTLDTVNDSADETDGSMTVTVNANSAYTIDSTMGSATVTITDNDP